MLKLLLLIMEGILEERILENVGFFLHCLFIYVRWICPVSEECFIISNTYTLTRLLILVFTYFCMRHLFHSVKERFF